jgi:hypothetical protein
MSPQKDGKNAATPLVSGVSFGLVRCLMGTADPLPFKQKTVA